jgi:hypothetical protein
VITSSLKLLLMCYFSDIFLDVFLPVVTVEPAGKCLSLRNEFIFVERLEIGGISKFFFSFLLTISPNGNKKICGFHFCSISFV